MHTGKGNLILRNGRKVPLSYQFGGNYDDTRLGYLIFDMADVDPNALLDRLTVSCDDGTELVVAVMHSTGRHLGVVGRVIRH